MSRCGHKNGLVDIWVHQTPSARGIITNRYYTEKWRRKMREILQARRRVREEERVACSRGLGFRST